MKTLLLAAALLGASAGASAQISAQINIGQPNFYGRIDVGDTRPQLVYERPLIIERRVDYIAEPLYLRVPPGHRKNWRKHCGHYNACGREVLFVQDGWYNNTYAPRYREQHGYAHPRGYMPARAYVQPREYERREWRDHDRHEGRGHDRHDEREERREGHGEGHGRGHDEGHGNGKGHGHDRD